MPDYIVGIVGYRLADDGLQHAVYLDRAGRQFIVDRKGHRVYGVWLRSGDDAPGPAEERNGDHRVPPPS
jgi:hypothetical protein